MYHRDLCYASAINKLSYFIKCLLPVVFVQLRKASMIVIVCVCTLFPSHAEAVWLPVAQMIKNLPAVWQTWVQSLEKGMATHSSILAWRIPWTEKPGGLQSMGLQRVGNNWATEQSQPQGYLLFLATAKICRTDYVKKGPLNLTVFQQLVKPLI